jgi:hypothetical protein
MPFIWFRSGFWNARSVLPNAIRALMHIRVKPLAVQFCASVFAFYANAYRWTPYPLTIRKDFCGYAPVGKIKVELG